MTLPLRCEVNDLWAKRQDDVVHQSLNPFIKSSKGITSLDRLQFHIAVMQWKCSLLSPDESETLRIWIREQKALNESPWAVETAEYGDSLVAENRYMQRSVPYPLLP